MRENRSKAALDGICSYWLWTTEELIHAYAFESGRLDRDAAKLTKLNIRTEIQRRFNATMKLLDDPQTNENPDGTYRYLLNV